MSDLPRPLTAAAYAERAHALQNKLYRMAYSYVKNEQDALEIVSEAVYKGYLSRDRLKDPALFDTWLTRIVINCALDLCRARGKNVPLDEGISYLPAPADGAEIEDRLDLYAALDTLPPEDKTLILLKYFEDLRFSDIAALLEVPENTVKTRLYRAIARLRKQYDL